MMSYLLCIQTKTAPNGFLKACDFMYEIPVIVFNFTVESHPQCRLEMGLFVYPVIVRSSGS